MTLREIISKLQGEGHKVEYRVRSDGGIIIKRIDSQRFTYGATGNVVARSMVGESAKISEARSKQLSYATKSHQAKKPTLDEDIEREYQRVKKKWRKAFKSQKGKPHPAGYFGKRRIRYAVEKYGKAEALRRIREAERYASGIAYSKNVAILASFIRSAGERFESKELIKLSEDLEANAYTIREEWIQPAYDELYKLNSGTPPKEVARNARAILRL